MLHSTKLKGKILNAIFFSKKTNKQHFLLESVAEQQFDRLHNCVEIVDVFNYIIYILVISNKVLLVVLTECWCELPIVHRLQPTNDTHYQSKLNTPKLWFFSLVCWVQLVVACELVPFANIQFILNNKNQTKNANYLALNLFSFKFFGLTMFYFRYQYISIYIYIYIYY